MKKGCKNCHYAEWRLTDKGNIKRSIAGRCKYKIIPPVLPDSIGRQTREDLVIAEVRAKQGKKCN
jgi:hypothetical protein